MGPAVTTPDALEALADRVERATGADRLSQAIVLAAQAHAGQVDKGGQPYILHVLRVMMACRGTDEQIAAVLHDTVEDCGFTVADISSQFGNGVANAVDALTRRQGEDYGDFIDRCRLNPIARAVKLADLADNMDLKRLGRKPTADDYKRMDKYHRARAALVGEGR